MKKWSPLIFLFLLTLVIAALYLAGTRGCPGHPQTSARVAISQIILACDNYYEEYHQLPLGSKHKEDTTLLTNGTEATALMHTLIGLKGTALENKKGKSFFSFKASKGRKDGLLRTEDTAELFDPWGSPYHLLLDYDYNRQLKDPNTREIITDTIILIWSPGPDKKSGTNDDIHSWK